MDGKDVGRGYKDMIKFDWSKYVDTMVNAIKHINYPTGRQLLVSVDEDNIIIWYQKYNHTFNSTPTIFCRPNEDYSYITEIRNSSTTIYNMIINKETLECTYNDEPLSPVDTKHYTSPDITLDIYFSKSVQDMYVFGIALQNDDSLRPTSIHLAYTDENGVPGSTTDWGEKTGYSTFDKYFFAPTQLTLKSVNELLPGVKALGKNGLVEGDDSVYNNLDINKINTAYGFNLSTDVYVSANSDDKKIPNVHNSISYDIDNTNTDYSIVARTIYENPWFSAVYPNRIMCSIRKDDRKYIAIVYDSSVTLTIYELDYTNKTSTIKGTITLPQRIDTSYYYSNYDMTTNRLYMMNGLYQSSNDTIRFVLQMIDIDTCERTTIIQKDYDRASWGPYMNVRCMNFDKNVMYGYDYTTRAIYKINMSTLALEQILTNVRYMIGGMSNIVPANTSERYFAYANDTTWYIYDIRTDTTLDIVYDNHTGYDIYMMQDIGKYTIFGSNNASQTPTFVLDSETNQLVVEYNLTHTIVSPMFPLKNAKPYDDNCLFVLDYYALFLDGSTYYNAYGPFRGQSIVTYKDNYSFKIEGTAEIENVYAVSIDTENDSLPYTAVYGANNTYGKAYLVRAYDAEKLKNGEGFYKPITSEEYNTAVDTTNEILGEEV